MRFYLNNGYNKNKIKKHLDLLISYLYKNKKFYISDLNSSNILVKLKSKNEIDNLIVIEGVYYKDIISNINLKYILTKKNYKNINVFKKFVYQQLNII